MAEVVAIFADGKRFEDYVSELESIEIDTEYPLGTVPGVEDARLLVLLHALKDARLPARDLLFADGSYRVLSLATGRALRKRELIFCHWFSVAPGEFMSGD